MTVRIVTDSVSDLPPEVVKEWGITVIPLLVRFGDQVYRDGVDLSTEEFYHKLFTGDTMPVTSVPPPAAFAEAYDRLAEETDEILAIILSAKLSGTYDVAKQSIGLMKQKCRVEVIDSQCATIAEGFIVMAAAKAAQAGANLDETAAVAHRTIPRVEFHASFDTLEYLQRGGRIGRAQAFLGSMLKVNPIITLKDGVVEPVARVHSHAKAIDHLYEYAQSFSYIEEMAVQYTSAADRAESLVERLGSIFPRERIYRSKTGPTIGTHTGPGLLLLAIMGDK